MLQRAPGVLALAMCCAGLLASHVAVADTRLDTRPRLALVIGNGAYKVRPLKNPEADARLMARTLKTVGFDVDLVLNANRAELLRKVVAFGRKLRERDAVGLFYFAGHGVQADGRNYILPTDIDVRSSSEIALAALRLREVLNAMRTGPNGVTIAILDSCRDNPLPGMTRSLRAGLAAEVAPAGTLIAYATAPGHVALDGQGANSPYTSALTSAIVTPGFSVEQVFKETRKRVLAATKGRQVPWEHSSLIGSFSFVEAAAELETSAQKRRVPVAEIATFTEIEAWQKIRTSEDLGALRKHLREFPGGAFEELVLHRIALLEQRELDWTWWMTPPTEAAVRTREAEQLFEQGVLAERAIAGDPSKAAEALRLYRSAADKGLASAMYALGRLYDSGTGTSRNLKEAARWYQRAADLNFGPALGALGTMVEYGEGVATDLVRALMLYRQGAERGDPRSMTSLAYLYAVGKGVARDPAVARKFYSKAAKRGDTRAQYNLAIMLQSRRGGRIDRRRAVDLLETAAASGHPRALSALARLHDRGRGVPRNPNKAASLFLKSLRVASRSRRTEATAQPSSASLRRFSRAMRRALQDELKRLGHYAGPSHGRLTRATRQALGKVVAAAAR